MVLASAVVAAGLNWPDVAAQAADGTRPAGKSGATPVLKIRPGSTAHLSRGLPSGRPAVTGSVSLPAPVALRVQVPAGRAVAATGTPAAIGPAVDAAGRPAAAPVDLQVLSRSAVEQAGGSTLGLRLAAPAGSAARSVDLRVDLGGVTSAYGGSYAGRLGLAAVPADCAGAGTRAARTPADRCWPRLLATQRFPGSDLVSATVPLPHPAPVASSSAASAATAAAPFSAASAGVIVIAAAVAADANGDYRATSLSAAGTWSVGEGSGSFSYSYPVPAPASVGGNAAGVSLAYDSGSVDGRTTVSNGQSSWLGQGWDLSSGFIERQYNSCVEDGQPEGSTGGESCFGGLRYFLNLAGQSSEMIPIGDPATATEFRLRDDSGWRIRKGTGADNGESGGEFFTVEDPSGIDFTFGAGRTPWSAAADTNSVWNRPILGDDTGEPGHAATLAGSLSSQGWRWNLDRVVDADGNAQALSYERETNRYRALDGTDRGYDRGGWLARIEYGGRASNATGATAAQAAATSRIDFVTAGRCLAALTDGSVACPDPASAGTAAYPDVPTDLICASNCTETGATFFTTRRLWRVNTSRLVSGAWSPVDRVQIAAQMLDADGAGAAESADLWLSSITRTGLAGAGSATLPAVRFSPVVKDNRINGGVNRLQKYRIGVVTNELGARTTVTYGHAPGHECTPQQITDGTIVAWTNVRECYPRWWSPPTGSPEFAWFHKYVVTRVATEDPTVGAVLNPAGGSPSNEPMVNDYEYTGDAAWHYDDQIGTTVGTLKTQSWGEWRGYGTVTVHSRQVSAGVLGGDRSRSTTRYFRGMDGDKLDADGGTKSVSVPTAEAAPATDSPWLRGRAAEQTTFDGAGAQTARTWHGYTARRTVDIPEIAGITTRDAYQVQENQTRERRTAGGVVGAVRTSTTVTYAEPADPRALLAGTAVSVLDSGSETDSTDDRCTTNTYTGNSTRWLRTVGIERSFSGACSTGTPIGRTDHYFDAQTTAGTAEDAALTALLPSRTVDYTSGTATITTSGTFDAYGRPADTVDGRGFRNRQSYTPATGVPTRLTMTSPRADGATGAGGAPIGFVTSTDLDPVTGLPVRTQDANGGVTTLGYDALQRATSVRLPAQQASSTDSLRFGYQISGTSPARVSTRSLQSGTGANAVFQDSFSYIDGMGRQVQAQTSAPGSASSRVLQVTRYDDRGLESGSTNALSATGTAGSGWVNVAPSSIPNESRTTYDWAGQPATQARYSLGVRQWQATYTRDAAASTITPPRGGAIRYGVDALGRTTSVTELTGSGSTFATTRMSYFPNGELKSLTTPQGAVTTHSYDWLGREVAATDPDTGSSATVFDPDGNVTQTTDARGVQLTTTFDALNRPTQKTRGANVLSSWTYDSLPNGKGLLASATAKITPPGSLLSKDYVTAPAGYDVAGRPTGSTWTIPSGFGLLSGQSFTETYGYDVAGHMNSISYPAIAGLKAETVTAGWSADGLPDSLSSSLDGALVSSTGYDALSRVTGRQYGQAGAAGSMRRGYGYDALDRLASVTTRVGPGAELKQDDRFAYTATDLTQTTDAVTGQRECYGYDDVRRLTRAFTTGTDCAGASFNQLAGPDPYNQSWSYDTDNNLLSFTDAALGGKTQNYSGRATAGQPVHAATKVSDGILPTDVTTMTFDASGNLVKRAKPLQPSQDLVLDDQQQLVSSGDLLHTTKFAYAADGARLIRQAPSMTTLYLGQTEVDYTVAGLLSEGRRYYSLGGVRVAMRSCPALGLSKITYLAADEQGSTDISVDATTGFFSRTRYTPYGQVRGLIDNTLPTSTGTGLLTDKGWLGAPLDKSTGLNALGARYYDGKVQQFTAPDPIYDANNPRSLNPYTYSWGNPIAFSDPTGLAPCTADEPRCQFLQNQSDVQKAKSEAAQRRQEARNRQLDADAKQEKLTSVAREGLTIIADLTGLKSIYDCVVKADMSGCISAAIDAAIALVGAGLLKVAGRVLTHFKEARRAAELVRKMWGLFQDARGARREAELAADVAQVAERKADDLAEAAAQRAGSACSFAGSTPVLMADGSRRPIDRIRPGDVVKAADPVTGRSGDRKVVKVWKHPDRFVKLVTTAGLLVVTATHPVWNATDHAWQPVAQLDSGDSLRLSDHLSAQVVRTAPVPAATTGVSATGEGTAYNLTVDDLHTYFAGAAGILVHNTGPACNINSSTSPAGGAKRGPKPFGTGAHNTKIKDIADSLPDDHTILGGGQSGLPETVEQTAGGIKGSRRPDISVERPDGSRYGINVGKASRRTGAPIKREAEAINDLEEFGDLEMHFVPYNT